MRPSPLSVIFSSNHVEVQSEIADEVENFPVENGSGNLPRGQILAFLFSKCRQIDQSVRCKDVFGNPMATANIELHGVQTGKGFSVFD